MRFRGLSTERRDVGSTREDMRREAIVQSVFARELSCGAPGDARPIWALMAYALGGQDAASAAVAASQIVLEHLPST